MNRLGQFACLAALSLASPAAPQTAGPALPEWMAGTWAMEDGAAWGDEVWLAPRGGQMLGMARTGFGPKLDVWEVTRIERKASGSISFIAQPFGRTASEFPLAVQSENAIEFANPAHDYPQRIRYWRQGQLLMAEISLIDGKRAMRFNYRPVASPPLETPPPKAPLQSP